MRVLLLGFIAILLLAAGAAGSYFYFQQTAEASIGDTAEHRHAGEAAPVKDKHDQGKDHKFVELDPLILPIVDNNGVNQIVSLVVVIEVPDEKALKSVQHLSPRLKDAFIQDMYGVLNKHAALRGGVVQVGMLKERLNRISDEVLGPDLVENVLLQVVQQRPL